MYIRYLLSLFVVFLSMQSVAVHAQDVAHYRTRLTAIRNLLGNVRTTLNPRLADYGNFDEILSKPETDYHVVLARYSQIAKELDNMRLLEDAFLALASRSTDQNTNLAPGDWQMLLGRLQPLFTNYNWSAYEFLNPAARVNKLRGELKTSENNNVLKKQELFANVIQFDAARGVMTNVMQQVVNVFRTGDAAADNYRTAKTRYEDTVNQIKTDYNQNHGRVAAHKVFDVSRINEFFTNLTNLKDAETRLKQAFERRPKLKSEKTILKSLNRLQAQEQAANSPKKDGFFKKLLSCFRTKKVDQALNLHKIDQQLNAVVKHTDDHGEFNALVNELDIKIKLEDSEQKISTWLTGLEKSAAKLAEDANKVDTKLRARGGPASYGLANQVDRAGNPNSGRFHAFREARPLPTP